MSKFGMPDFIFDVILFLMVVGAILAGMVYKGMLSLEMAIFAAILLSVNASALGGFAQGFREGKSESWFSALAIVSALALPFGAAVIGWIHPILAGLLCLSNAIAIRFIVQLMAGVKGVTGFPIVK